MNKKRLAVLGVLLAVAAAFVAGMLAYQERVRTAQDVQARANADRMVRMHSPVFGPQGAPVTIVEFFDPACETCRAFYPFVKDLLARHPEGVRLVIRYAPFHAGSEDVVKLLEAARRQGKYQPVLEAVLAAQPAWADHARPDLGVAFRAAEQAGLDLKKAMDDVKRPDIQAIVRQDVEDLTALQVTKTPTFFVNGKSLPSFGPRQLEELVARELAAARK